MASYIPPPEIHDILERFANTPVEAILHKPYVKLALNKLRFVPITMGLTHFLLLEMPIVDLIQMGILNRTPCQGHFRKLGLDF